MPGATVVLTLSNNGGTMPDIQSILSGTDTVTVPFGGEKVKVTYKVGDYTMATMEAYGERPLSDLICHLVESWDLTVGKGKEKAPYEVTPENVANLPLPFQRAIIRAIATGGGDEGEADASSFAG